MRFFEQVICALHLHLMTLSERDRQVIWHPYTQQKNMTFPLPIVRGEGALLYDESGTAYIDATSSWWVNIHGHAHPWIAESIYRQALQLEHVIFAGYTHEPAVRLAERLLPHLPGDFARVFYSDNGSTAVEVALKMSIQYWVNKGVKRNKLLAFRHSYHGDTFGAMSVSDRSVFTVAFNDFLFEVVFIDTPDVGNIEQLQRFIQAEGDGFAAFIYEPLLQGAGGMRLYDAALLDLLLATCQEKEVLCIADEVMTGFGRTGPLFASSYMTSRPDIICLSKGLTGGSMALGVTACTNGIYEAFLSEDKLKTLFHGHSFTANPIACAAALASLDLVEKSACSESRDRIHHQHHQFLRYLRTLGNVRNPRVLGTMLAFELKTSEEDAYLNNIGTYISTFALQQQIMLRPLGNTIYILPPYCITLEQLDHVYNCISEMIQPQ